MWELEPRKCNSEPFLRENWETSGVSNYHDLTNLKLKTIWFLNFSLSNFFVFDKGVENVKIEGSYKMLTFLHFQKWNKLTVKSPSASWSLDCISCHSASFTS